MAPLEYTLTTMLPLGSSTKPVDCRYTGSGLTKAPVSAAMASASVVDREGGDLDVRVCQRLAGSFEGTQLSVAVRAPGEFDGATPGCVTMSRPRSRAGLEWVRAPTAM
jgi:hypothetical protein